MSIFRSKPVADLCTGLGGWCVKHAGHGGACRRPGACEEDCAYSPGHGGPCRSKGSPIPEHDPKRVELTKPPSFFQMVDAVLTAYPGVVRELGLTFEGYQDFYAGFIAENYPPFFQQFAPGPPLPSAKPPLKLQWFDRVSLASYPLVVDLIWPKPVLESNWWEAL